MKYFPTIYFSLLAALFGVVALSSCNHYENISGAWTGMPVRLGNVPYAADATAVITMDYAVPERSRDNGHGGSVMLTALIDVNQAVSAPNAGFVEPYEVSVAATASISGRYAFEDGDDDDVILMLEPASLQVNIDPAGVTYSQNLLTGKQQPELDSLTTATIGRWRLEISKAIRDEFYKYQRISDIEIHHGSILTCEIEDRDYSFRKAQ